MKSHLRENRDFTVNLVYRFYLFIFNDDSNYAWNDTEPQNAMLNTIDTLDGTKTFLSHVWLSHTFHIVIRIISYTQAIDTFNQHIRFYQVVNGCNWQFYKQSSGLMSNSLICSWNKTTNWKQIIDQVNHK